MISIIYTLVFSFQASTRIFLYGPNEERERERLCLFSILDLYQELFMSPRVRDYLLEHIKVGPSSSILFFLRKAIKRKRIKEDLP